MNIILPNQWRLHPSKCKVPGLCSPYPFSLDFKYLNDHIRITHILNFKLWTQNSEILLSLALGKYDNSVSFPGFWILQLESYLHIYFQWNYGFLAANGKATQGRVWWYKALRTVDTTTGGWQMGSPATDVGTGKGELCRAAELPLSVPEKDTIQRRWYVEDNEDASFFISHFMLHFVWKHCLQRWDLTGGLWVGLGWRSISLQHFKA